MQSAAVIQIYTKTHKIVSYTIKYDSLLNS